MQEWMLGERQSDRATLREHYESARRQGGPANPDLEPKEFPEALGYLWGYFIRMSMHRRWNGTMFDALPVSEMRAWAAAHCVSLSAFEFGVLEALESAFLANQKPLPKKAE